LYNISYCHTAKQDVTMFAKQWRDTWRAIHCACFCCTLMFAVLLATFFAQS